MSHPPTGSGRSEPRPQALQGPLHKRACPDPRGDPLVGRANPALSMGEGERSEDTDNNPSVLIHLALLWNGSLAGSPSERMSWERGRPGGGRMSRGEVTPG